MRLRRSAQLGLCALAAATVLLSSCTLGSSSLRCEAQINRNLSQLQIPQSDVRSIREAREGSGRKNERNENLTAWVRLKTCNGAVVMTMTRTCFIRQTYTTGNCRVPGLRNF